MKIILKKDEGERDMKAVNDFIQSFKTWLINRKDITSLVEEDVREDDTIFRFTIEKK
jgi:hypothetical protein